MFFIQSSFFLSPLCYTVYLRIHTVKTAPPSHQMYLSLFLPEGKRSMTGWLSTCSVALPPLRVNRTTWYLPSLTITALSSMVMSSVPTLKITPIFPRSYRESTEEEHCKKYILSKKKKATGLWSQVVFLTCYKQKISQGRLKWHQTIKPPMLIASEKLYTRLAPCFTGLLVHFILPGSILSG